MGTIQHSVKYIGAGTGGNSCLFYARLQSYRNNFSLEKDNRLCPQTAGYHSEHGVCRRLARARLGRNPCADIFLCSLFRILRQ